MKITYSKLSNAVQNENQLRFSGESKAYKKQVKTYQKLRGAQKRSVCILCRQKLRGELFQHRSLPFISCGNCCHIQLSVVPPKDYCSDTGFHTIYPKLSKKDYENRKARIYEPKLNWIVKSLKGLRYSNQKIKNMRWFEIGSGAGYFLSTLKDFRVKKFGGCDSNRPLVELTNQILKSDYSRFDPRPASQSIGSCSADIYVAFFVLEHIEDAHEFMLRLSHLPKGTIFVFSVPVFGFAALLDNVFTQQYARNLDGIVHTQIYTDESIQYALKLAQFKMVAQWVFGQDIDDLVRYLLINTKDRYSSKMTSKISQKLAQLQDEMQSCLDRNLFSDQRHVIAVKQ